MLTTKERKNTINNLFKAVTEGPPWKGDSLAGRLVYMEGHPGTNTQQVYIENYQKNSYISNHLKILNRNILI